MIDNIIKIFSIIFCSIYTYNKITHNSSTFTISKKTLRFIYLIFAISSCILNHTLTSLTYFAPLLALWFIVSYFTEQPQKSFISVVLSFTISFGMHSVISFIISSILYSIFPGDSAFPYEFLALLSSALHILSIRALCKTKRLRKGMPFLSKHSSLNIATFISILLIFFTIFLAKNDYSDTLRGIIFLVILFVLAFLIYWWQAQITKSYRRSLELRELESLRTEVAEQNILIQRLMEENEKLARITHRDNTLISTLKNSTVKYLSTDFDSVEEATAVRNELIANITTLSEGRSSLPPDYSKRKAREFGTDISLLNELLNHMDVEAIKETITFSVHLGTNLKDFVPRDISESDLVHLVDDLLKNAFKATKRCEKRVVQLQFYKLGKHFVVEVADNGIPFEVESLVNLGIEKRTTYEDGSGIGLMDIWNTKENCGATYHIEEYESPAPFSKKISLTFDKKNRYSIRTWRKDEILQMSKRTDLQVYGHQD